VDYHQGTSEATDGTTKEATNDGKNEAGKNKTAGSRMI